ncbi:uncharacterized protein [Arachis hypogaea]|uniref:uncharacterized protein n=1 Tax=Arachis hypogaea TaxID=3818 RepID=UPI000DEC15D0|nr:uncharacterized protein LOC112780149 [Arachis hypogaea]
MNFVLMADELYKKGIDGSLSRCLGQADKDIALREVHRVLPLEINLHMLRILSQDDLPVDDYWNAMYDELNDLDSECILALKNMIRQKESVARNYNRRIKDKCFSIGELVLKVVLPMEKKSRFLDKWSHTWEGPFQVIDLYSGNAY